MSVNSLIVQWLGRRPHYRGPNVISDRGTKIELNFWSECSWLKHQVVSSIYDNLVVPQNGQDG